MNHNLLTQTNAVGLAEEVVTTFGYDTDHHLRFVTNAVGTAEQTVTETTYTAEHKLDTVTVAKGTPQVTVTDYDYNSLGLVRQVSEGNGLRVTTTKYDAYGLPDLVSSTDAGTIDFDYNARGELVDRKDAENQRTHYTYTPSGKPERVTYATGTGDEVSTSNTYWKNGLLKTVTDGRGKVTRHYWNAAYQPTGTVFADGSSVSNRYDASDRLVASRDALGNWTTNVMDKVGRPISVSSAHSSVTNKFDVAGNLTYSAVDPDGLNLWKLNDYDNLNRLKSVQSAQSENAFDHDVLGRVTNRVDAASKNWGTEFDVFGRPVASVRPSGARERTDYNALGQRTTFWNAENKPVRFGVDAQGRVTAITNAIDKVTSFGYGEAGNLEWKRNAEEVLTEYGYDPLNRLVAVTNQGVEVAAFNHDSNGNVILASDSDAAVAFGYDEMNRLAASTQSVSSVQSVVQNQYDLNGNRTAWQLGDLAVQYHYGADNRLESISTDYADSTDEFSFEYDTANRLTGIASPNGVQSIFGYDAESRITSIQHGSFVNRQIERNALGFKETECINAGIKPTVPCAQRSIKTHNDADRLVSERVQTETTNWTDVAYFYNENGGLETVTTNTAVTQSFGYDYENRLSAVHGGTTSTSSENGGASSTSTEYLYDASGARVGRIHNSVTNYFVIDYTDGLKRPLAETDAAGNITRYYVWNGAKLLCHIEPLPGGHSIIRYYHANELGSTLALTDESGAVTDEFAYMPYGYATHTGDTDTPYQWLGGYGVYYDSATELHLTLHRAYSCKQKRFISPDPLGIDGGVNVYMWANLNPLAFVDPYGLCAESFGSKAWNGIKSGAQAAYRYGTIYGQVGVYKDWHYSRNTENDAHWRSEGLYGRNDITMDEIISEAPVYVRQEEAIYHRQGLVITTKSTRPKRQEAMVDMN